MTDRCLTAGVTRIVRTNTRPRIVLGRKGLNGRDARCGVVLMVGGKPSSGLALGPYFPTSTQSFTSANSIIGCAVAPTDAAVFTIKCDGVVVGMAVIVAGARTGAVTLVNGGFEAARGALVEAICPVSVDATLTSPSLSLA